MLKKILLLLFFFSTLTQFAFAQKYFQIGLTGGAGISSFSEEPNDYRVIKDINGGIAGEFKTTSIHKGYNISLGIEASYRIKKVRIFLRANYSDITITDRTGKTETIVPLNVTFGDIEGIQSKGENIQTYSTQVGVAYYFISKNHFSLGVDFGVGYYWGKYKTNYGYTTTRYNVFYSSPFYNMKTEGKFDAEFSNRYLIKPGIELAYKIKKFEIALIPNYEFMHFINNNPSALAGEKGYTGKFNSYNLQLVVRYKIFEIKNKSE